MEPITGIGKGLMVRRRRPSAPQGTRYCTEPRACRGVACAKHGAQKETKGAGRRDSVWHAGGEAGQRLRERGRSTRKRNRKRIRKKKKKERATCFASSFTIWSKACEDTRTRYLYARLGPKPQLVSQLVFEVLSRFQPKLRQILALCGKPCRTRGRN